MCLNARAIAPLSCCRDRGRMRRREGALCLSSLKFILQLQGTQMNRVATRDKQKAPSLPLILPLSLQTKATFPAMIYDGFHQLSGARVGLALALAPRHLIVGGNFM